MRALLTALATTALVTTLATLAPPALANDATTSTAVEAASNATAAASVARDDSEVHDDDASTTDRSDEQVNTPTDTAGRDTSEAEELDARIEIVLAQIEALAEIVASVEDTLVSETDRITVAMLAPMLFLVIEAMGQNLTTDPAMVSELTDEERRVFLWFVLGLMFAAQHLEDTSDTLANSPEAWADLQAARDSCAGRGGVYRVLDWTPRRPDFAGAEVGEFVGALMARMVDTIPPRTITGQVPIFVASRGEPTVSDTVTDHPPARCAGDDIINRRIHRRLMELEGGVRRDVEDTLDAETREALEAIAARMAGTLDDIAKLAADIEAGGAGSGSNTSGGLVVERAEPNSELGGEDVTTEEAKRRTELLRTCVQSVRSSLDIMLNSYFDADGAERDFSTLAPDELARQIHQAGCGAVGGGR